MENSSRRESGGGHGENITENSSIWGGDGRKGGKLLHKKGVVKRREAKWKIAPLGGGGTDRSIKENNSRGHNEKYLQKV